MSVWNIKHDQICPRSIWVCLTCGVEYYSFDSESARFHQDGECATVERVTPSEILTDSVGTYTKRVINGIPFYSSGPPTTNATGGGEEE